MKIVLFNKKNPDPQKPVIDALYAGLEKMGFDVVMNDKAGKINYNIAACWGWRRGSKEFEKNKKFDGDKAASITVAAVAVKADAVFGSPANAVPSPNIDHDHAHEHDQEQEDDRGHEGGDDETAALKTALEAGASGSQVSFAL